MEAEQPEPAVQVAPEPASGLAGAPALADADCQPVEFEQPAPSVDPEPPADPEQADSAGQPAEVPEQSAAVAARQERAAGRIIENERLRGDLTDDEYQPLQDWALTVTDRVAASTAELDDEAAEERIDTCTQALAEILEAAGYVIVAHNEGDADRRRRELDFVSSRVGVALSLDDDETALAMLAGQLATLADRLDAEPDLSGRDVASAIAEALALPVGPGAVAGAEDSERPPDADDEEDV